MKNIIFVGIINLLSFSAFSFNSDLPTVEYVEVEKYMGKWYEIARFDHSFQEDCVAVTADYKLLNNGNVEVINRCRLNYIDGKKKKAKGIARIHDRETNAKLKVQFFLSNIPLPFLAGDYWILALGEDYEYAMVGEPKREYLWILSRTPQMEEGLFLDLVSRAEELGFEVDNLLLTPQPSL